MRRLTLLFVLALSLLMVASVAAQDGLPEGAGQGGSVVIAESADITNLNPLLPGDADSAAITDRIYPGIFGINRFTGSLEPGWKGSLATDWSFNDDGTVLTVSLRQDAFWSDGEQITADDYIWVTDALRSGLVETQRSTEMFEVLDDGTPGSGTVTDVVALDDFTIQITFSEPSCSFTDILFDSVVPSHIFEEDWGDDLAAMNEEPLYLPGVTFGAWTDLEHIPGDRVNLLPDHSFPDSELGYISPGDWTQLNLPDNDVIIERFRAGELTIAAIPGAKQAEFENDDNYQTYRFPRRGYVFFVFNFANPENPLPAFDEEGNAIEQDPHPILSDKLVRQAIVYSVDMDAIIENNLGGNAVRVGLPDIPASWAFNDDLLYPFDPARANELLDEAGWIDEDGNGFRECVSCSYLEIDPSYAGTEMTINLNDDDGGSEDAVQMVEFIAQSMRHVGINAERNAMDWSSAFVPALLGQTFDMAILAWSLGLPLDPNNLNIFGPEVDVPGAGFNFGSYNNPTVTQLYNDGLNPEKTDGCTLEGRKAIYDHVNEILFDELPYMFMYANLSMTAAQNNVENWDPAVFSRMWQEDAWTITNMDQP